MLSMSTKHCAGCAAKKLVLLQPLVNALCMETVLALQSSHVFNLSHIWKVPEDQ